MSVTIFHKADSRGHANHGWLDSHHSFSFAGYHNPERVHFGALRVLNDDSVTGGMGFGKHPHDNMEIVSIPLKGALEHNDTTGRKAIIKTGDVQIMSAGSGISHSEVNASKTDAVNFLQIWVFPKLRNIPPRYEQKTFETADRKNKWQLVVSPEKETAALWINQDAWFSMGDFNEEIETTYTIHQKGNGIYAFIIEGSATINGQEMNERDGAGITGVESIIIKTTNDSKILLIEVPMDI
ncbi:MAG: pirin family protein [Chitinophagaceae bacterium]|nr:pirin family protein [Chitinophagaceae bacterium]